MAQNLQEDYDELMRANLGLIARLEKIGRLAEAGLAVPQNSFCLLENIWGQARAAITEAKGDR
jgi:hypothetical protein